MNSKPIYEENVFSPSDLQFAPSQGFTPVAGLI